MRTVNHKALRQVALRNNIHLSTLRYRLRVGTDKMDAICNPTNKQKLTARQVIQTERLGLTIRSSATLLGVSKSTLRRYISILGITWRGKGKQIGYKSEGL